MSNEPEVIRMGLASLQVCVPREFSDKQVEDFANGVQPTCIGHGWAIRHEGNPDLKGCHERVDCEKRRACVHVMLDC
jgi:hypothetical protein